MTMRHPLLVLLLAALLAPCARAEDASERMVEYLDCYHRLSARDVDGRLKLADWCEERQMLQQQADLLSEIVKIDPAHAEAYARLLDVDAKRSRSVDSDWARKLDGLLGDAFHLHHTRHFTLLADVEPEVAQGAGQAMEDAYALFYRETVKLGMRPMPPPGRLVCVLFNEYDQYRDFERRYELADTEWATGAYSWRTNRTAFFYERDNPGLKDARQTVALAQKKLEELRGEMDALPSTDTAGRLKLQNAIRQTSTRLESLQANVARAVRMAMASKTSHEATHQLLYNAGLQHRGRGYPFWFNEGLATAFEIGDRDGHAGPSTTNRYRLNTWREAAQTGRLIPLTTLLTSRPADNDPGEKVGVWYAQSWALMHFLWNRKPASLVEFWKDLEDNGTPRDIKPLFTRHFGEDLDALDREVREHIQALR